MNKAFKEEVIGAKAECDPEKCQKKRFAPARRSSGGPAHFINLVF
jgi:lipoate-protein ligase A